MACDDRYYRYRDRNCDRHCNMNEVEEGIIEIRKGLHLLKEGLRDMHRNHMREAEREFRYAEHEIEEGLDDILRGLRY